MLRAHRFAAGGLLLLVGLISIACSGPAGGPPAGGSSQAAAARPGDPAAGEATATRPREVTVAYGFISAETLPIWLALDAGLYEKQGLRVTAIPLQTSAQVVPAMTSGEVQFALITGYSVVESNLSGGDLVIVAGYSNQMRYFLHARPDIRRVEDLRGKRLGITRRGGAIGLAAEIFLEKHGLVPGQDAVIVELGTAQNQIGGLAAGAVDAAVVALPTNLIAERQGFPFLEDTKQHNVAFVTNAVTVRRPYLASDAETVQRYLRAHIEAVEVIRRDKELAKRILGQYTNTDDDELLEVSYHSFIADLQDVPYPSPAAIQGVLDAVARDRPAARDVRPAELYDDRLVREIDQAGFVQAARAGAVPR